MRTHIETKDDGNNMNLVQTVAITKITRDYTVLSIEKNHVGEAPWILKMGNNQDAYVYPNGDVFWFRNSLLHREDGPACLHAHGKNYWYLQGSKCTKSQISNMQKRAV